MKPIKKWSVSVLLLFFAACSGLKLFPTKDPWYTQHYIIMQEYEWEAYKELTPAGKAQFQELFWKVRDPSAKATFESRLEYVNQNFKKEKRGQPWNTDRGRIYLLHGQPAEVRYVENNNLGGIDVLPAGGGESPEQASIDRSREDIGARMSELWVYSYQNALITYEFSFVQPRMWKLKNPKMAESTFLEELERKSRSATYGITDVEGYKKQLNELKGIL